MRLKGFCKMRWKRAGSGSAGDVCKSSMLSREAEKMCMQNFCVITKSLMITWLLYKAAHYYLGTGVAVDSSINLLNGLVASAANV